MEAAVELVMLRGEEAVRATASNVEKSPVKAAGFCVVAALCMLFMLGTTTNSGSVLPVPMPRHTQSSTSVQHSRQMDGNSEAGVNPSLRQVTSPSEAQPSTEGDEPDSKKPEEEKDEGNTGAADGDNPDDGKDDDTGADAGDDGTGGDGGGADKDDDEDEDEGGKAKADTEDGDKEADKGAGDNDDGNKDDDKEAADKDGGGKDDGDTGDGGKDAGDKEDGANLPSDKADDGNDAAGKEQDGDKVDGEKDTGSAGEDGGEGEGEGNEKGETEQQEQEPDDGAGKDGDGEGDPKAGAEPMGSEREAEGTGNLAGGAGMVQGEVSKEVVPEAQISPSGASGRLSRTPSANTVSRVDTMAGTVRTSGMAEEGNQGSQGLARGGVEDSSKVGTVAATKVTSNSGGSSTLLKKYTPTPTGDGAAGAGEEDSTQGAAIDAARNKDSKAASFSGLPDAGLRSATSGAAPAASGARSYGGESRSAGMQSSRTSGSSGEPAYPRQTPSSTLKLAMAKAGMGSSSPGGIGRSGIRSESAPASTGPGEGGVEEAKLQGGALPTFSSLVAAQSESRAAPYATIPNPLMQKRPFGEVSEEQRPAGGVADAATQAGSGEEGSIGDVQSTGPLDAKPDAGAALPIAGSSELSEERPRWEDPLRPSPVTEGQQQDETLIGQPLPSSESESPRVQPGTDTADMGGSGSWKSEAASGDPPPTAEASNWAAASENQGGPPLATQGEGQPNTREDNVDEALQGGAVPRQAEEALSQQVPATETFGDAGNSQENVGAAGAGAEVPGGP